MSSRRPWAGWCNAIDDVRLITLVGRLAGGAMTCDGSVGRRRNPPRISPTIAAVVPPPPAPRRPVGRFMRVRCSVYACLYTGRRYCICQAGPDERFPCLALPCLAYSLWPSSVRRLAASLTIRYEMLFFHVRSKADTSQLNLPHGCFPSAVVSMLRRQSCPVSDVIHPRSLRLAAAGFTSATCDETTYVSQPPDRTRDNDVENANPLFELSACRTRYSDPRSAA